METLPRKTCYKVIFGVVPMTFFLGADLSISTAFNAIQTDLHVPYHILQWLVSANCIVLGTFAILTGKIGDAIGLKKAFLMGILISFFGSLIGAFAPNIWMLIVARVFQGLGCAFIAGIGLGIFARFFPNDLKKKGVTAHFLTGSIGTVVAPYLNGTLVTHYSWRYIFFFWAAYCLVFFVLSLSLLPKQINVKSKVSIRVFDSILLCLTIGLFIVWISQGGKWHFASMKSFFVLVLAIISGSLFADRQRKKENPLIDLSLFTSKAYTVGCITAGCLFFVFLSYFYFFSLYFLQVKLVPASQIGNHLIPLTVGLLFALTILSKLFAKVDSKRVLVLSLVTLFFITNCVALGIRYDISTPLMALFLAIAGISLGVSINSVAAIVMCAVPPEKAGLGAGVFAASRFVGGTIGVAVFTSVFTYIGSFDFTQVFAENHFLLTNAVIGKIDLVMSGTLTEAQIFELFPKISTHIIKDASINSFSKGLSETIAMFSIPPAFAALLLSFILKKKHINA